ncbi:SDR family oxidoreductase [Rugamonas apoptosis]|uniref:SDR family oxidoreductase n=1 Tax=Rugamonas apoptosis TaxID=2758570 RepID=UPI001C71019D|nr:SDR family oxidoreductase [Rugamonas apoptosis]
MTALRGNWTREENHISAIRRESGRRHEEARHAQMARERLHRLGQPEDIAALAVFLSSQTARHIPGTAIVVDGGSTSGLY